MSAIAYITDSKMLELHRLNEHKTMNFWRLSNNVNFSDFHVGDLVFFLSKDKEHMNKKEKGIVGFGRLRSVHLNSIRTMWEKYSIENGYGSLEDFKMAILKVSKDHSLPKKISSFYLENVTFFSQPIHLSEYGMKISNSVESYIYLKPEQVVINLLEYALSSKDLWSASENYESEIMEEEIRYCFNEVHRRIGNIHFSEKLSKRAHKTLKQNYENTEYGFVQGCQTELFLIQNKELRIVFYHDREVDERLLLGQAKLYRHYLSEMYPHPLQIRFETSDDNEILQKLLNE